MDKPKVVEISENDYLSLLGRIDAPMVYKDGERYWADAEGYRIMLAFEDFQPQSSAEPK